MKQMANKEKIVWMALHTHNYGTDAKIVAGKNSAEALKNAKKVFDFEPERGEDIEVSPLVVPDGFKIVRINHR